MWGVYRVQWARLSTMGYAQGAAQDPFRIPRLHPRVPPVALGVIRCPVLPIAPCARRGRTLQVSGRPRAYRAQVVRRPVQLAPPVRLCVPHVNWEKHLRLDRLSARHVQQERTVVSRVCAPRVAPVPSPMQRERPRLVFARRATRDSLQEQVKLHALRALLVPSPPLAHRRVPRVPSEPRP